MPITVPSWFKGRQGKTEEVRPGLVRASAPNMADWFVGLTRAGGGWMASVYRAADEPAVADRMLDGDLSEYEAWEAAFEVYRNVAII